MQPAIFQRALGCRFVDLPALAYRASAEEINDLLCPRERSDSAAAAQHNCAGPVHVCAFLTLAFGRSFSWRAMHAVSLGHFDRLLCGRG
jgi:hypothetical protein